MKTAIVCEGGGMRGIFTAGVLQSFIQNNFLADELIGVSAGASNGSSYVSRQSERAFRTNMNYIGDKKYLSVRNLFTTRSLFGMDYLFKEIPLYLDPFDFDAFYSSPCNYYAGATNLITGKCDYFSKNEIHQDLLPVRASCSLPVLSPIVWIHNVPYLDGGASNPIPIDKALADGCDRIIVILTRDRKYRKKPESFSPIYSTLYRKYPKFVQALRLRHLIYNHTLEKIAHLEQQGIAIVAAPEVPLEIDRFGQDKEKLLDGYYDGLNIGDQIINKM